MSLFPADMTDPWNDTSTKSDNLQASTLPSSLYEGTKPSSIFSDNPTSSAVLNTQSAHDSRHDVFLSTTSSSSAPALRHSILLGNSSAVPSEGSIFQGDSSNVFATGNDNNTYHNGTRVLDISKNLQNSVIGDPVIAANVGTVEGGDSEDIIAQNGDLEELLDIIRENKIISLSNYKLLFDKYSSYPDRDSTVKVIEFIKIEEILESNYQLNQIQIENLFNYITNNPDDALRVNYGIFEIIIGLAELEFEKLGEGNLTNLKQYFIKYKRFPLLTNAMNEDSKKANMNNSMSSSISSFNDNDGDEFSYLDNYNIMTPDLIKVIQIPEKEGLFMKHINYLIKHDYNFGANTIKKVVRRYSDFLWLNDILLTKYPFRLIPALPPKGFSGNNNDPIFLDNRRRQLNRYLNLIMKHPILSKEVMVIMFLTIPTDLNSWKKKNLSNNPEYFNVVEEFEGKKISKKFISYYNENWQINNKFEETYNKTHKNLSKLNSNFNKIILYVERFEKRKQLLSLDNDKFVDILNDLTLSTSPVYNIEPNDIELVNHTLKSISTHIITSNNLLKDECQLVEEGVLKDFKDFREYLNSLINLFERKASTSEFNDVAFKKRIETNQAKLQNLRKNSADVKNNELQNLIQSINQDKQHYLKQINKKWLIKKCILHELKLFQKTQYMIIKAFKDWCEERLKYSELQNENWVQLVDFLVEIK